MMVTVVLFDHVMLETLLLRHIVNVVVRAEAEEGQHRHRLKNPAWETLEEQSERGQTPNSQPRTFHT